MTDKQLRDEAMTLFLAGHDTTALVLSWGWYVLAQHPEVVRQLEAELRDVLGGRTPSVADLPRLRYTDMVVQEIMRLYPPAYVIGREAVETCELGGWRIPAGGTVLMSQWVVQRDPRFYDEPERFYPARWADGLAKRLPKYAYFPFGGGPRVCIGNTFAATRGNAGAGDAGSAVSLLARIGDGGEAATGTDVASKWADRIAVATGVVRVRSLAAIAC